MCMLCADAHTRMEGLRLILVLVFNQTPANYGDSEHLSLHGAEYADGIFHYYLAHDFLLAL